MKFKLYIFIFIYSANFTFFLRLLLSFISIICSGSSIMLEEYLYTDPMDISSILNPEPEPLQGSGSEGERSGGPQPQGEGSGSVDSNTQRFDTTKLGNYLQQYIGSNLNKTNLDIKYNLKYNYTGEQSLSRILAHVKSEHLTFFAKQFGKTPVNERLINRIIGLNKNYHD